MGATLSPERSAAWVFSAWVLVAFFLLVFKVGSFFWFFRDDWAFITDRQLDSPDDLFRAHAGHWSTVPVVVFRVLYAAFGIRTYIPYQSVVVAMHLGVVVLLRVVMRRAGVGPWLATVAAGTLALFGPGREDILWAFQIGFTGAILFGLIQLLLADHDGDFGRKDLLALGFGFLAIASSSTGIVMVVVVGVVGLVRHGWKRGLIQTLPLALVYGLWAGITHPKSAVEARRPGVTTILHWVESGQTATFRSLGHSSAMAWILLAITVAGTLLMFVPSSAVLTGARSLSKRERVEFVAAPAGLFVGSFVFMFLTAQERWIFGVEAARAGRYVYFGAVLTLPLLAIASQELARRWRWAAPLVCLLLLATWPSNISAFDDQPFGPGYFERRRLIITTVLRLPLGHEVSGNVQPVPDPFDFGGLDLAFLREARKDGKLKLSTGPISPELRTAIEAKLTLSQAGATGFPDACETIASALHLRTPRGTRYIFVGQGSALSVHSPAWTSDTWVRYDPGSGNEFTVQINDLDLEWMSVGGPGRLCRIR